MTWDKETIGTILAGAAVLASALGIELTDDAVATLTDAIVNLKESALALIAAGIGGLGVVRAVVKPKA